MGMSDHHSWWQSLRVDWVGQEKVKIWRSNNFRLTCDSENPNIWTPWWLRVNSLIDNIYFCSDNDYFYVKKDCERETSNWSLYSKQWWSSQWNQSVLCSLFVFIPTGQRSDGTGSDIRRHKSTSDESQSPHSHKAANGMTLSPGCAQNAPCDYNSSFPKLMSEINQELLTSGAVILPGKKLFTLS